MMNSLSISQDQRLHRFNSITITLSDTLMEAISLWFNSELIYWSSHTSFTTWTQATLSWLSAVLTHSPLLRKARNRFKVSTKNFTRATTVNCSTKFRRRTTVVSALNKWRRFRKRFPLISKTCTWRIALKEIKKTKADTAITELNQPEFSTCQSMKWLPTRETSRIRFQLSSSTALKLIIQFKPSKAKFSRLSTISTWKTSKLRRSFQIRLSVMLLSSQPCCLKTMQSTWSRTTTLEIWERNSLRRTSLIPCTRSSVSQFKVTRAFFQSDTSRSQDFSLKRNLESLRTLLNDVDDLL